MKLLQNFDRAVGRVGSTRLRRPLASSRHLAPRPYSTELSPPPLLAKLKGDLKAAMKARDAARLTVLRSILASTLNASKTAKPIQTDAQLVALLRKTASSSQEALDEFRSAGRDDLADKESAQIKVLEEYVSGSGLESVGGQELKDLVSMVMSELAADGVSAKSLTSEAMKQLLASGGPLDGKDVDKTELIRIVKEASPGI